MRLTELPARQMAQIDSIDWAALAPAEARRLRELGFAEGVSVELTKRSGILGGPLACRVGRMLVALRRAPASVIRVSRPQPAE